MSPRQTSAPSRSDGRAAMPRFKRGREPAGEFGVAHPFDRQFAERSIDRVGLVAEHGDDRPRPRGEQPSAPHARTIGRPSSLGEQLVRAAHPRAIARPASRARRSAGLAAASPRASARRGARPRRGGSGRDGISARRPPLPMRMISPGPTGRPATSRSQHPVEAVDLGRAGAAGKAEHRLARRHGPRSSRLPGSTGMPKCSRSGRPRRRSPPGSRRGGRGSPRRRGSKRMSTRDRSRRGSRGASSAARMVAAFFDDEPAAERLQLCLGDLAGSCRGCSPSSPGSRVWMSPTERAQEGGHAQQRTIRARRGDAALDGRRAARRTG